MAVVPYSEIFEKFRIDGEIVKAIPFGNGLINKTFRLHNADINAPDYLLQRINDEVFSDIPKMTDNLRNVTSHLRKNKEDAADSVLTAVPTHKGNLIHVGSDNDYWRMFLFLKNLRSYDQAPDVAYVKEGAKAFGQFVKEMSDFSPENLHVVIPDFHHLGKRIRQLNTAKLKASKERKKFADSLFNDIDIQCKRVAEMLRCIDEGRLSTRVTHNDTKFNNVLFSTDGEARCVVDLDTTMPGIIHYDFGDGIRTGTVDCKEDESDPKKIAVQDERLQAYCEGYLEPLLDILSPIEIQFLPLAAPYMSLIMAVRFLTDYLNEDIYYHIQYPDQNLARATCQMRLSMLFYEKRDSIKNFRTIKGLS